MRISDWSSDVCSSDLFRQILDAAPVARRENYEATHSVTWAKPAAVGKHTMIIADHLNPRPDYIREESAGNDRSGGAWRPFLKGETALLRGDILGDRYYAVTAERSEERRGGEGYVSTCRSRGS